jgi:hypothetical protein
MGRRRFTRTRLTNGFALLQQDAARHARDGAGIANHVWTIGGIVALLD